MKMRPPNRHSPNYEHWLVRTMKARKLVTGSVAWELLVSKITMSCAQIGIRMQNLLA